MKVLWKKKTQKEIEQRVYTALKQNINYDHSHTLGIPASHLDEKVFSQDESFLEHAPFISTLVQNPNHIGCHTLGSSESFFQGTQAIEKELMDLCALDILDGSNLQHDGYVASGGTEANLQAIWVYRNYYEKEFKAKTNEICILCSEDSHYSMDKAANILGLDIYKVLVDDGTREVSKETIDQAVSKALENNKKYFIVICNMMTTMFGSIDDPDHYVTVLKSYGKDYKIHVDGAFGGFYYPFTNETSKFTFNNDNITSFTLDAHKMAQAPYGTGIFLIRKGFITYTNTQQASYVEGEDCTLIGSRSGANAVAVWMILMKYGFFGWQEKIFILQKRTQWMAEQLLDLNIAFYRHPNSNIITIRKEYVTPEIAHEFGLVPDNHHAPKWYKIVVMDHVTIEKLQLLVDSLKVSEIV